MSTGIKYKFTPNDVGTAVNFVNIFPPKPEQLARFIRISHIENPTSVTIYFDPASHFLWRCMNVNGTPQWSADSLPCSPPVKTGRVLEEVERAWKYLMDIPLGALEDGARRRISMACSILAALGR